LSSIGLWIRMEGGFNACGPNFNRAISGSTKLSPAKKNRKERGRSPRACRRSFRIGRTLQPEGLRATGPAKHTLVEMGQLFTAGPDDEQVEAPTFLRGDPLRITERGRYA
jgi:hypothetical protein